MGSPDPKCEHAHAAAELFDAKADTWADKYSGILKSRLEVFRQAVNKHVPKGGEVLDFGCGAGVISLHLAQDGYKVKGIDISPDMIARAQDGAARLNMPTSFAIGDVHVLQHMVESYDAVVSSSVVEYLPSSAEALKAMSERLRPGGHAIISVPNRTSLLRHCERSIRAGARLSKVVPLPVKFRRYTQYLLLSRNHFSVNTFSRLAAGCGLSVIEHTYLFRERPDQSAARVLRSSMLLFVMVRK